MEEVNISTAAVASHALLTCIPWLIGIGIGGGLGALCALGIRAIFSARPELRRPLVLLPWRTLVTGLLMVVCSPFIVRLLGLGLIAGGVMVAGSVCLLAMAFTATTLVENEHPSPVGVRLIAGARTLAVASALVATGVGLLGGGGLGYMVLMATRLMRYGLMVKGLLVILTLTLTLDLALGLVQLFALGKLAPSSPQDICPKPPSPPQGLPNDSARR